MAEEKSVVRIGGEALQCIEALAEDQEISNGEAAERLIMIGWNRRKALTKWSKAQKKEAKPKAKKSAKPKKAKSKKAKAKSHANGVSSAASPA